jgi:hypothetical protein
MKLTKQQLQQLIKEEVQRFTKSKSGSFRSPVLKPGAQASETPAQWKKGWEYLRKIIGKKHNVPPENVKVRTKYFGDGDIDFSINSLKVGATQGYPVKAAGLYKLSVEEMRGWINIRPYVAKINAWHAKNKQAVKSQGGARKMTGATSDEDVTRTQRSWVD